jgi:hypothetical protein
VVELWAFAAIILGGMLLAVWCCLVCAARADDAAGRAERAEARIPVQGIDPERLAHLLAFSTGDLRDTPRRCAHCDGAQIEQSLYGGDYERDVWRCPDCGHLTSGELVARRQLDEAAAKLGVLDQDAAKRVLEEWLT